MSQFIFDQIYGSEAKKNKIMSNNNFLYYRQMMKIKNKHVKNQSLYQQVYQVPTYNQPLKPRNPSFSSLKTRRNQNLFLTLNQENYAVQKINSHAFKILKRKNKNPIKDISQEGNIQSWAHQKGYMLDANKRMTLRTIDSDAKRLRKYLVSPETNKHSSVKIRNLSVQLDSNRTARTNSKFQKSDRQTSDFSPMNRSDLFFSKY